MKRSYIFSITNKYGNNNLVVIHNIESREEAVQKAKIEILSDFKGLKTDANIIKLFHELGYTFNGTAMIVGESFKIDIL